MSVAETTGEWTSNIWGGLGSVTQSSEVDTTADTDRQVQWLTAPAACEIMLPVLPGDNDTSISIKAEPVTLSDTDIMTILYSKHDIYNHSSDNINFEIARDCSSWNSAQNEPIRATDAPKKTNNEPVRCTCIQGSSKSGPVVESAGVTEAIEIIKREPVMDADSATTIQPVGGLAVSKTDTAVSMDSWSPRDDQERLPSQPQPEDRQVGQKWEVFC